MVKKPKPKTKAKPKKVEPEKVEEPKETPTEEPQLLDFGSVLNAAGPLLEGLLSTKEQPEERESPCCKPSDEVCEVHIIGSEEMILKLFGKA